MMRPYEQNIQPCEAAEALWPFLLAALLLSQGTWQTVILNIVVFVFVIVFVIVFVLVCHCLNQEMWQTVISHIVSNCRKDKFY